MVGSYKRDVDSVRDYNYKETIKKEITDHLGRRGEKLKCTRMRQQDT